MGELIIENIHISSSELLCRILEETEREDAPPAVCVIRCTIIIDTEYRGAGLYLSGFNVLPKFTPNKKKDIFNPTCDTINGIPIRSIAFLGCVFKMNDGVTKN